MSRRRRQHIARRRLVKRARRAIVLYCQRVGALAADALWRRREIAALIVTRPPESP